MLYLWLHRYQWEKVSKTPMRGFCPLNWIDHSVTRRTIQLPDLNGPWTNNRHLWTIRPFSYQTFFLETELKKPVFGPKCLVFKWSVKSRDLTIWILDTHIVWYSGIWYSDGYCPSNLLPVPSSPWPRTGSPRWQCSRTWAEGSWRRSSSCRTRWTWCWHLAQTDPGN